jgi:hypothetical protein
MRYPGCEKAKAFKLFDQGKRPSEIYHLVKVAKHTLYSYYQLWKREQEEESKKKRQAAERQQRLEEERREREHKQEEEMWKEGMAEALRAQRQIPLGKEYRKQKEIVLQLEAQLSMAADMPNNVDGVQRIGEVYSQEYEKFIELTRKLYPQYADEESIQKALHPNRE